MMTTLAVGSAKGLILLIAAAGLSGILRRQPARLRVVVWSTALIGSLLIPLVTPLLPSITVPVPIEFSAGIPDNGSRGPGAAPIAAASNIATTHRNAQELQTPSRTGPSRIPWAQATWVCWLAGALFFGGRLAAGVWGMRQTVRRAHPISDPDWLEDLSHVCRVVGCRRSVRLVASDRLDIPATVGLFRPTLLMPAVAATWPRDRREAVLLHELVHVDRLDWPLRLVARSARAAYWFNPLAWWAVRRLDLEQELACDEEVIALGTRPSSYAWHLLGIARTAIRQPNPALCGLESSRKSQLEQRIMTILESRHRRRAGLMVLAPVAVLVAAMVPALAAIAPTEEPTSPEAPELKEVLHEIEAAEARMAPHLERMEDIELDIDEEALADVEERMKPYLEEIQQIEVDLEPYHEQMARIEDQMKDMEIFVEPGTLEEIEQQIHSQLEEIHRQIDEVHVNMEPLHEQLEAIHLQMEPLHEEMARLQREMEPIHERMEEIQRGMEPLHEEMELLGKRLDDALRVEVAGRLRAQLGPMTGPEAPFNEAAAHILERSTVRIDGGTVTISGSATENGQILTDLLGPHRIGASQNFDNAVRSVSAEMSQLEIRAD